MDQMIVAVNRVGEWFASVSYNMFLQSSLVIIMLAVLDCLLRNRTRALVRYSLWMLLLVKLVLPVNLSLPTSVVQITPVLNYTPPEYAGPNSPAAYNSQNFQLTAERSDASPSEAIISRR